MTASKLSRILRLSLLGTAVGASAMLTGCIVAPIGPPVGVYHRSAAPVYVEPSAAVVVVPGGRGYYGHGYRGRPHGGYYGNRGYRGDYDGR